MRDGLKPTTLAKRYPVEAIIAFGLVLFVGGAVYGMTSDRAHYVSSLANAIVTLGSGVILGSGLKLLLELLPGEQEEAR